MNAMIFLLILILLMISIMLLLTLSFRVILYFFKKQPFPRRHTALTVGSIAVLTGLILYRVLFYSFDTINLHRDSIQKGYTFSSPDKQLIATSVYELYGGAAGGVNLIVYITNNETGDEKIIYLADAQDNIGLQWIDNETVAITNQSRYSYTNYSISLKAQSEIYHQNGYACRSLVMKSSYEDCYSSSSKK